jgi:hypothetical protein
MKLASYIGTRAGIMGLGNVFIRLRLGGQESHSEIVFEPGDGPVVAALMPDGTLEPDADGALWCCSSVGLERMPSWSRRRPGHLGGVRFKRIVVSGSNWELDPAPTHVDPLAAAWWAAENEGSLYDWWAVVRYLFWVLPQKLSRGMCSEVCARMFGVPAEDAHLLDPRTLRVVVRARLL